MQFSVIRSYAATRFRDPSNAIVLDTDWKNYVNTAYGEALMALPFAPWNELSTTLTISAASRSVALPTDCDKVLAVWNSTDQYPMVPLEGRSQVFNEYPQQIETGSPMHYRILAENMLVYPLPQVNTSFTVEYLAFPAALVADSDLPAFPSQYHDMLVAGAVAKAYTDDGNTGQAEAYSKEFDEHLARLITDTMQPRQDRYYEIVDTNW